MLLLLCLLAHPGASIELAELDLEIRQHPDRPKLYLERADFLRTVARFPEALADLDVAEALGAPVDGLRARIHEMRGEDRLAETFATRALESRPAAHLYFLRGRLRERAGRNAEALADYRAAGAMGHGVELFRAEARVSMALGRTADAVNALERGIAATGSVVLRRDLIRIAAPELALEQVQVVLQSARVKTDWLLMRADLLARLGRDQEAAQDRAQAVLEAERLAKKRPSQATLAAKERAESRR